MQRLTIDERSPRPTAAPSSRSAISTDSTSATRRWSGGRSRAASHERRPVIVATFDPHPVRHFKPDAAPFPPDHARPARAVVRRSRRRRDAGVRLRRAPSPRPAPRISSRDLLASASAPRASSPARTSPSARAAAAMSRCCGARRRAWHPRRDGRAGAARRRARCRRAGSATRSKRATPGRRRACSPARSRSRAWSSHGDKRGRELGFPTANSSLADYQRPAFGIYAVRVRLDDGSEHDGVANLGIRPTFEPPQGIARDHLFDFDGDLYGRTIEVALRHFIRPENKFDGLRRADRPRMARSDCRAEARSHCLPRAQAVCILP